MTIASEWADDFRPGESGADWMARKKSPGGSSPASAKIRRESPEADIQAELVRHVSGAKPIEPLLDGAIVHSHPNEATWKSAKLRGMGVYRGISDLEFVRRGRCWFMECKAPGRYLTDDEAAFRDWCQANGTPWAMVDSVAGGLHQLREWGLLRMLPAERR